ncbi:hypothetical protein, partial [Phenylobacterium sp.]|uniref:hypothetical protein n=1 Tax=Phenylobacterium sp. TaxID=1871053 RepID=UPI0025E430EF
MAGETPVSRAICRPQKRRRRRAIRQARKDPPPRTASPLGDRLDVDTEGRGYGLRWLTRLNTPHDFGSTVLRQPGILV